MSLWFTDVKGKRHTGTIGRKLKLLSLTLWHPVGISLLLEYKKMPIEIEKNGGVFVFFK